MARHDDHRGRRESQNPLNQSIERLTVQIPTPERLRSQAFEDTFLQIVLDPDKVYQKFPGLTEVLQREFFDVESVSPVGDDYTSKIVERIQERSIGREPSYADLRFGALDYCFSEIQPSKEFTARRGAALFVASICDLEDLEFRLCSARLLVQEAPPLGLLALHHLMNSRDGEVVEAALEQMIFVDQDEFFVEVERVLQGGGSLHLKKKIFALAVEVDKHQARNVYESKLRELFNSAEKEAFEVILNRESLPSSGVSSTSSLASSAKKQFAFLLNTLEEDPPLDSLTEICRSLPPQHRLVLFAGLILKAEIGERLKSLLESLAGYDSVFSDLLGAAYNRTPVESYPGIESSFWE